jgi:predicted lactoylglutathione lyase
MYYDSFADLDGHQWEIMFTEPTQIMQQQSALRPAL